jgi:hypothetical protein
MMILYNSRSVLVMAGVKIPQLNVVDCIGCLAKFYDTIIFKAHEVTQMRHNTYVVENFSINCCLLDAVDATLLCRKY